MVEPEVDVLHGQVVNEDTEMPIGTDEEVGSKPDEGDEESNPDG
jgi:hypothetical protein